MRRPAAEVGQALGEAEGQVGGGDAADGGQAMAREPRGIERKRSHDPFSSGRGRAGRIDHAGRTGGSGRPEPNSRACYRREARPISWVWRGRAVISRLKSSREAPGSGTGGERGVSRLGRPGGRHGGGRASPARAGCDRRDRPACWAGRRRPGSCRRSRTGRRRGRREDRCGAWADLRAMREEIGRGCSATSVPTRVLVRTGVRSAS